MVTIEETDRAMKELVIQGKAPNGKLAFYNACLSTRNRLDNNCRQSLVMRQYAEHPLPINKDELRDQLGRILTRTLNSLYEIEKLWHAGLIHFNCGGTFDLQSKWRDSMVALIPGMGMKTVSFALHIYAPSECRILTIDVWHLRRLHSVTESPNRKRYLAYEQELLTVDIPLLASKEEKKYPIVTYAACIWENYRQYRGVSQGCGEYQSHAGLSCYA